MNAARATSIVIYWCDMSSPRLECVCRRKRTVGRQLILKMVTWTSVYVVSRMINNGEGIKIETTDSKGIVRLEGPLVVSSHVTTKFGDYDWSCHCVVVVPDCSNGCLKWLSICATMSDISEGGCKFRERTGRRAR